MLEKFIEWHNKNYPEKYIPNSEIGRFNIEEIEKPIEKLVGEDEQTKRGKNGIKELPSFAMLTKL